jgi:uncharacterized protein YdeI (YjbR/CyaY-like superfamily)
MPGAGATPATAWKGRFAGRRALNSKVPLRFSRAGSAPILAAGNAEPPATAPQGAATARPSPEVASMARTDRRIDAYIAHAAPFAQPILARLREDVHAACPDAEEAVKWSMPFFMHGGRNLAHMAAFKAHCAFGFEMGRAVVDLGREAQAMGQFGRITKLDDLPPRAEIRKLVKKAAALIDAGVPTPRAPKSGGARVLHDGPAGSLEGVEGAATAAVVVPEMHAALAQALRQSASARRFFETLAAGHRRDYIVWVAEAKREETRARRIAQAIAWLAEGKRRQWRYERR